MDTLEDLFKSNPSNFQSIAIFSNCSYNIIMDISFKWDENKNLNNQKKHGVSFEEAKTVFYDNHALEYYDPDHSQKEDRFILLGMSAAARILVVCHCYRSQGGIIRIISARKATSNERLAYEK